MQLYSQSQGGRVARGASRSRWTQQAEGGYRPTDTLGACGSASELHFRALVMLRGRQARVLVPPNDPVGLPPLMDGDAVPPCDTRCAHAQTARTFNLARMLSCTANRTRSRTRFSSSSGASRGCVGTAPAQSTGH